MSLFFLSVFFLSLSIIAFAGPPNIVLIFIDDMGWGDFSCFGNQHAKTPHIDRLAKEGLRFDHFYVNSPICSPSRVAISTGQYPQRWKISSYLSNRDHNRKRGIAQWLDPQAPMLARSLKEGGYATGHFGKWHMGGQRNVNDAPPISDYGFEESLCNFEGMGPKLLPLTLKPGQTPARPNRLWEHGGILGKGARWMLRSKITEGFVNEAISFIEKAKNESKLFYLNLWPDDVHTPFWPPVDQWRDGSKRQLYLSVLEEMDRQLGKLIDHIRNDPTLTDNTLILACSDNGPEKGAGVTGPFRGYKTHLFEGGIRSPLVAWAPSLIHKKAQGTRNKDSIFSAIDLVPTLLDITGIKAPGNTDFDGESLPDILLGKSHTSREQDLFFRRPPDRDSFYGVKDLPDLAIRSGKWKLLCEYDGSNPLLYDLSQDPGEKINLASTHLNKVKELSRKVRDWHHSMPPDNGPKMATKN